jgi:hypothetical protein
MATPTEPKSSRVIVFEDAIRTAAGPVAERMARRRGVFRERELTAFHEAAHTLTAVLLGRCAVEVSIIKRLAIVDGRQVTLGGYASSTSKPKPERQGLSEVCEKCFEDMWSDRRTVARLAWILAPWELVPEGRWRPVLCVVRQIQQQAAALLDQHWNLLARLAGQLQELGILYESEIAEILDGQKAISPAAISFFASHGSAEPAGKYVN